MRRGYEAGVFTGKAAITVVVWRKERLDMGTVYFTEEMLKTNGLSFKGSRVVVSGSGNVSTYAMEKAIELGANVIRL